MTALDKVKQSIGLMQEGFAKFDESNRILSSGSRGYYAERVIEYAEFLFERYAPFKVGDRAIICKAPNCNNSWSSSKQDLVKGAKCTVSKVDVYKGEWQISIVLDVETWIDRGIVKPKELKSLFCLGEDNLVKV